MEGQPAVARESSPEPDQDKLIRQLERQADRILGKRSESFVDSSTLCSSCSHAGILRRESQNHRLIICSWFSKEMPEDVKECSKYFRINELSLAQMASLAHFIEVRDTNQGYL